jgi:sulfatase maturation enzyme AslB (radical SAM superfamily)
MNNLTKIQSALPSDLMRIEIFPGDTCNYNCRYCLPVFNEGKVRWPDLETITDRLSHVMDYYIKYGNKKRFVFQIIGGEPTLWPECGEFVKFFKDRYDVTISMSSNGSRTLRWWEEYGKQFDHIIMSCHHEKINVEHTIEVCDSLYDNDVWVNAMVLMDSKYWDKCVSIIEGLKNSRNTWSISTSQVIYDDVSYTPDQLEFLANNNKRLPDARYYYEVKKTLDESPTVTFSDGATEKVSHNWLDLNGHNNFLGWECNIGVDTIYIDKTGTIKGSCGQVLFGNESNYNIYDKDFKDKFNPEMKPSICTQSRCNCFPEQRATKRVIPLQSL